MRIAPKRVIAPLHSDISCGGQKRTEGGGGAGDAAAQMTLAKGPLLEPAEVSRPIGTKSQKSYYWIII